jgi:DNA mismatch repair protein MutL
MGRIRVLDEAVANQIAAGEVVERPASVVKELVENALDAGASRIDVEVDGGGAGRIRVADDGSGMEPDDARLAFERHATSKIRAASDLRAIASFGFRGEALPSIASVSRVVLTTATGPGSGGTRVRVDAGRIAGVEPAAHPRGTTVQVEGLFHNAPARRKFLRSPATETGHVADLVSRLAAVHAGVAFSLRSGGRPLAAWSAVQSFRDRVTQIVGPEDAAALVGVDGRAGDLRLLGLASSPALQRSTARDQHLYVNGRPIRDRRLLHAIQQAYLTIIPRGRYPVVYLVLEVPPDEVDVNVHPAKSEVRFLRAGAVHDLVREALLAALGAARPFYRAAAPTAETSPSPAADAVAVGEPEPRDAWSRRRSPPPAEPEPLFETVPITPLAQFRDSYILASAPDGLVILDQHAAHERVLYERFLSQAGAGRVERQRLLFPVTLEVTPAQRQAFEDSVEALDGLGFGASAFGEDALKIDEVPDLVATGSVERLVRGLLDEVLEWRKAEGMDRLRHRLVASAACHAAVRANHTLDAARMKQIVTDLLRTDRPMTCPHGRPALLRLTLDQIEKEFHRR